MDKIQKDLLEKIADLHGTPEGAYNIRSNGALGGRNTTANIDIVTKTDKQLCYGHPLDSYVNTSPCGSDEGIKKRVAQH